MAGGAVDVGGDVAFVAVAGGEGAARLGPVGVAERHVELAVRFTGSPLMR